MDFFKNWKTTSPAIATVIVWLLKLFGVNIDTETASAISVILLSLSAFFAKDGDRTGVTGKPGDL